MTTATVQPSAELQAVYGRIEKALEWFKDNDPRGAFHLWFTSRILPGTPMPGQSEEVQEQYRRYHKNRVVFERLWNEMENRERIEGV